MTTPATTPRWVLHLSTETGWRGGERQVWYLARGLQARSLPQAVAAPTDSPLARECEALGVDRLALPARPLLHPVALLRLAAVVRQRPGALLHAHTSRALDAACWLARLAPCAGIVHTRRVAFPVRAAAKYRTACLRYVAISRAVADGLRAAGTPTDRLSVIPSAVDFAPLAAAVPVLSPFPGHPLVGCVAQMTREKGVAVLGAAWRRVATARPDARLVLIGDGPERAATLAALGTAAGSAHFAGFCNDVPAWLKALTIYVQPSLMEGLGSTVIDALGCGLPVIASRAGGLPEVVGGDGGILVPPNDPAALADAILRLLGDPAAARAFAATGEAFVRHRFTIEAMVAAYAALYRDLGLD